MKVVLAAFNQEKALVGAFSVITNLRMELFEALLVTLRDTGQMCWVYQSPDTVLYIFPLNFVCPITDNSGSHTWQYMAHTDNGKCRNKTWNNQLSIKYTRFIETLFPWTYHDDDWLGFDSFGTGRVSQSVGRLGQIGPCRGHARDLKIFWSDFIKRKTG